MRKIFAFTILSLGILLFTGCAEITRNYEVAVQPYHQNRNAEKIWVEIYLNSHNNPFNIPHINAGDAIYHLAKIAKERGYNYIKLTYPRPFLSLMFNKASDLKKCYTSPGFFGKCADAFHIYGYGFLAYDVKAIVYKTKPVDVLTMPADGVIKEFKEYDNTKYGYKTIIKVLK